MGLTAFDHKLLNAQSLPEALAVGAVYKKDQSGRYKINVSAQTKIFGGQIKPPYKKETIQAAAAGKQSAGHDDEK